MDLLTPPLVFKSEEKPAPNPPAKRLYTDWQFEIGGTISRLSSIPDLLQNCDLPPPLKVFSPILQGDKRKTTQPFSPTVSPPTPTSAKNNKRDVDPEWNHDRDRSQSHSLLRALQLSQTRAREAEREAALASLQNQQMAKLLLEESLRLYAHRHWVKLLEIEILMLQDKRTRPAKLQHEDDDAQYNAAAVPATTMCLALALCLGIAGVGFLFGRSLF